MRVDRGAREGRGERAASATRWAARRSLPVFAALLAAGGLAYVARPAPPPASSFAEVQRGHLRRLDGASAPERVVFLGSSTFQGLDVSAVTPVGLNLSIGGDTLAGLTARAAGYRSLARARAVVVNIGLNDLLADCALPSAPVDRLLALVPAATPVFIVGVQQVDPARHRQRCAGALPGLIDAFNGVLAGACGARPGCRFVAHPLGAGSDEALREADGIHLSVPGYRALVAVLRRALGDAAVSGCVAA